MKEFQYAFARSVYLKEGSWRSPLYKAFLQVEKEEEEEITIIGRVKTNSYLYLGPADHDLEKLGTDARLIDSSGKSYRILSSRKVYKGDKVFYIRAILEREGV